MQIQADYRNSNINRYKNNYLTNKNKSDVSFEGLNIGRLFSRSKSSAIPERAVREYTYQVAGFLGLKTEEIASRIKGLSSESRDFLFSLSRKFSDINFGRGGSLKEDPMLVFDVLRNIERPKDYHYSVLSNTSGSFGYISRIFSTAQDKKSMEFVLDFQDKILKNNPSCKNILVEMLNSSFKKQYMKNIDDFKSYIMLNKENPEAVKELDLLMQTQQYSRKDFDIRLAVNNVLNSQHLFSGKFISRDNLEKHYSMSGIELLDKFTRSYYLNNGRKLSAKSELNVFEMYKTADKNNIEPRLNLIEKFKFELQKSDDKIDDEIATMKKLFDLMDSDKHAMKFVDKVSTTTGVKFDSIQQLYDVIAELTPRKADIFSDNVFRIVRRVESDELIPTLKEQYNNPFFETKASKYRMEQMIRYRYKQPESYFSKLKRAVLNKVNEFKLAREDKQALKKAAEINSKDVIVDKPQVIVPEVQPVNKKPVIEKITIAEEKTQANEIKPEITKQKPIAEQEVQENTENVLPFEWNTQKALPSPQERRILPKPEPAEQQVSGDTARKTPSIKDFQERDKSISNLDMYKRFSHIKTGKKPPVKQTKSVTPQPQTTSKKPNNTQSALPIKPINTEPKAIEHIISNSEQDSSIKLVNIVKESPKARKLRLIGEVNEFIAKKLSAKTVEKQGEIYSKNATKMRLKMLPEIFDSIKETRQTDRTVGKLKSISANKDAVDLYRLINGSNRKYVKYLLEKRNVDGTRMFEVKDIIAMVEKANKRVDAMKKANPDFKAKDAKAYFDHLYDAKIEQYGKVKRSRKK